MARNDTPTEVTEAPAKKKRASFTRTEKPIYAVVTYSQDGETVKLDKANLKIVLERDASKIMEQMENTDGKAVFVKLDMPKATNAKPAETAPTEAPTA